MSDSTSPGSPTTPTATPTATPMAKPKMKRPRGRRGRIVATSTIAVSLAVVLGFLVYASTYFTAQEGPLASVRADPAVTLTETSDAVVMTPTSGATGRGLVFVAGARVDPAAYAYTLSGLTDAGITVVIARPILGFAILEFRALDTFTALAPAVTDWAVGGHSLGGVRSCQYIADRDTGSPETTATGEGDVTEPSSLILVGSYCAVDLSDSAVPVLSISGSEDGLSTPEKITDAAPLLPGASTFVEIAGASHASFGAYGVQPGDGTPTASPAEVRDGLTGAVLDFFNTRQ
ncbi:MAG: alpha/beta hydrolase [Glaciihabitans sp.]|nr:alpha/beta hydrolase [Glaciihabitans sp.]